MVAQCTCTCTGRRIWIWQYIRQYVRISGGKPERSKDMLMAQSMIRNFFIFRISSIWHTGYLVSGILEIWQMKLDIRPDT